MDSIKIKITVVFIALFTFILIYNGVFEREPELNTSTQFQTYGNEEDEFVLVYLGSSECVFCKTEELPKVIRSLSKELKHVGDSLNFSW